MLFYKWIYYKICDTSHLMRLPKIKMGISFAEEKDNVFVIYMDDITVFSKYDRDHIKHLKNVFLKCRRDGISLNAVKFNFP